MTAYFTKPLEAAAAQYTLTAEARSELAEMGHGDFADCVWARYDVKDVFAPICGDATIGEVFLHGGAARHLWADMLVEVRR